MSDLYEKLRSEARAVLVGQTCGCPSAKCGATAGCPYCGDSGYLHSEETSCAAAAEALADLGPVLDAFFAAVRLSATSSDGAVDMNYDVCMDALLTAWTTARAKLVTT